MKAKEFAQLIQDGLKPVVTFTRLVEDQESYTEPNMRARVVGVKFGQDNIVKFTVDFSEFDEFNKQYETANYWDDNHQPTLTARQAGFYKPTDIIWADADQEVCFEVEESNRLKVYEQYKKDGNGLSYVQWLEDKVNII